jgi:hypothetical protein
VTTQPEGAARLNSHLYPFPRVGVGDFSYDGLSTPQHRATHYVVFS